MSSEFIDIVLFGAIAIFLVYRLRSILGSSDGKIVNIRTKKNSQSKFKPKIVPKKTTKKLRLYIVYNAAISEKPIML